MGYSGSDVDDLEKLRRAVTELAARFGSVDSLLESVGLADLPTAQRYGIMFGIMVFLLTITAVVALLVLGGSFKRIADELQTGQPSSIQAAHDLRAQRALLLEQLLEGRQRMNSNYQDPPTTEDLTNLTKMLLNEAPGSVGDDNNDDDKERKEDDAGSKGPKQAVRSYPAFYKENYTAAYLKCQDRPGGAVLSGRPEARFEAYARAYAGCGPYTTVAYRRSYSRMYESICCESHQSDDKHNQLFDKRPQDIVGRHVRLEALEVHRHLQPLFHLTSGEPLLECNAYDPQEVWSFQEDGPFENPAAMRKSFVFQHHLNEASFAVVNGTTDQVWGAILLSNDNPKNLSIQLETPLWHPAKLECLELQEACFLVMDRLFALGYRRIQFGMDSQDSSMRKLAIRLGFTHEGTLYKHMVVKDASRDTDVFGMLNSDWREGARAALFTKLYGIAALRSDKSNEKKEEEFDEQARYLAEKKQLEANDKKDQ